MAKRTSPLLPATERRLGELGERIRLARLRRKLAAGHVAQRAGMSPMTLRGVERGGPGVTIGAYAAVLQVLGLEGDIDLVGAQDALGRELQDSRLRPPAARAPDRPKTSASPVPSAATPAPSRAPAASPARTPPHRAAAPAGGISAEELAQLIVPGPPPARRRR
ncbi:MAG TPA: helix-turn-helix domain-containing protein [Ramlibacter sp.]|nr:helix-turn-helix domain-containing protein [Ramlibacter sp.]